MYVRPGVHAYVHVSVHPKSCVQLLHLLNVWKLHVCLTWYEDVYIIFGFLIWSFLMELRHFSDFSVEFPFANLVPITPPTSFVSFFWFCMYSCCDRMVCMWLEDFGLVFFERVLALYCLEFPFGIHLSTWTWNKGNNRVCSLLLIIRLLSLHWRWKAYY